MNCLAVEDAKRMREEGSLEIIDIRDAYELEICTINGTHIPMTEIFNRTNELSKDKAIAIMCRSGKRAEAVTNALIVEHGFENIYVLEGGILNWIEKLEPTLEVY